MLIAIGFVFGLIAAAVIAVLVLMSGQPDGETDSMTWKGRKFPFPPTR
jgi:hypothetical protein